MVLQLVCALAIAAHPASYLARTADFLEASREDIPHFQPMAEEVAKRICTGGGKLYAGGNPALISEMSGRAGGLMLIAGLGEQTPAAGDAVLFFADDTHPLPEAVARSGAAIVLFGAEADSAGATRIIPRAKDHGLSPTHGMAIQGWLFTAEIIAACTREGKMPVLFESIGLYGGIPRMQKYQGKPFHDDLQMPRLAVGDLSEEYVRRVSAMLQRCEREQRSNLERAGQWAARALAAGQQPWMYNMGHLFPDEVANTDIGKDFRSAVWNAGFSYLEHPQDTYGRGEAIFHIGYQLPPLPMLQQAKTDGARAVYVSVTPDRDFTTGPSTIWIDPMWPFADACVPIPGYDIPGLPASGVINAALAWELDRLANMPTR